MRFRPCIDIHNGKVKQIVGSTLSDSGDAAEDNFVSLKPASYYAGMYKRDGLSGGHVIFLNSKDSEYYEKDLEQGYEAFSTFPGGLDAGGGVDPDNAQVFLKAGAAHVIVTSYVFRGGRIDRDNLEKLVQKAGADRLVLDLSCRYVDNAYHIVTDRWQKVSEEILGYDIIMKLSEKCSEFLIHAVDVEGKADGSSEGVLNILADCVRKDPHLKFTYAGGIRNMDDIQNIRKFGDSRIDFTVGSALDIFGGSLKYESLKDIR
ncbi:MAG: phosphoribosylformimino-5-aminoimidazole carboxamide ribotide isomerase [Lachnospiraceae bacterium]|jgi:phosphoribosylformimino-5-aminoimidazole carboxamide ribotide isomerase|nr:phosphoribosylformimino-5-aminoimidazole carboxamide ribotide isomerase [Lachnospiraceae bacterium]